jgi:hypothetical protein
MRSPSAALWESTMGAPESATAPVRHAKAIMQVTKRIIDLSGDQYINILRNQERLTKRAKLKVWLALSIHSTRWTRALFVLPVEYYENTEYRDQVSSRLPSWPLCTSCASCRIA